jgi:hypothetical protein
MEEMLNNMKFFVFSWKFKTLVLIIVLIAIAGIYFGKELYGYIIASFLFWLIYFFSKQAESEHIISPKEKNEMIEDYSELKKEADLVRDHINETKEDLEAKLYLHSLEKEMEVIKRTLDQLEEKK